MFGHSVTPVVVDLWSELFCLCVRVCSFLLGSIICTPDARGWKWYVSFCFLGISLVLRIPWLWLCRCVSYACALSLSP